MMTFNIIQLAVILPESGIKKGNRQAEAALVTAEKMASVAFAVLGLGISQKRPVCSLEKSPFPAVP